LGSGGDAAMSDLEFQRELSPEQIREALSLLDGTAGAQNQNVGIEDLRPAEEVNPEPDHSSTTMAPQDRPPAAKDPQQRKKHLTLAAANHPRQSFDRMVSKVGCEGKSSCSIAFARVTAEGRNTQTLAANSLVSGFRNVPQNRTRFSKAGLDFCTPHSQAWIFPE